MRKQQEIWEAEHARLETLPSYVSSEPSSGVLHFKGWLEREKLLPPRKLVDIGCGKGRNAVYLAKAGYEVFGMDYVQQALDEAEKLGEENNVSSLLHFHRAEIDSPWPFEDEFFDLALDCFSSIDIETTKGREVCRDEMLRTLKPGGHAFVAVVSVEDEIERELLENSPGPERNSVVWPQNGKFQKDYDEEELREFYSAFEVVELKEVRKPSSKLGRNFTATNYWLTLRKPSE